MHLRLALNFLLQSGIGHYSVSKCRWKLVLCMLILGTVAGHMMTLFCKIEYLTVQWRVSH